MLTETTVSPWSLYFLASARVLGNFSRHGPHHVAQKSTSTTFPFWAAISALYSSGVTGFRLTLPLLVRTTSPFGEGFSIKAALFSRRAAMSFSDVLPTDVADPLFCEQPATTTASIAASQTVRNVTMTQTARIFIALSLRIITRQRA